MPPSPELIDISRPLAATTACWPGDVPFSFRLGWTIADGASVNVGAVETSVHTGTHCDAPYHYDDRGATVDAIPLDAFVGPCWVLDAGYYFDKDLELVFAEAGGEDNIDLRGIPRVLYRSRAWPDTTRFPDRIPCMRPEFADWLGRSGIRLVGVDLPSVDPLDSKSLDVHRTLGRHGITILEGLWLEDVPAGRYELIALPLKLIGADGSPVRAVLRPLG
jgi:arylformamidase